jgi:hypothetical protein
MSILRCAGALLMVLLVGMQMTGAAGLAQDAKPSANETRVDDFKGHPRVIIISDIGNEPDDQMSFTRLLVYSNELDLEALIASTSTWQKSITHPETMHALVAAYAQVRANLMLHAQGWPAAELLDSRIASGQPEYGMASVGAGKSSAGSKAIIQAVDRQSVSSDARPVWVCLWGGANTLAQALLDVRASRTPEQLAAFVAKLRVNSISDQDDAGAWIRKEFPELFYIVQPSDQKSGEYFYATWTGISGDRYYRNGAGADFTTVTNEWLETNIRSKGPMGKMYPRFAFIMEGDTPSFLGLIDNGLGSWRRPDWGGWGGRYVFRQPHGEPHSIWTQGGDEFFRSTSQDTVVGVDGKTYTSDQASIWRWREAFQHDFAARMSWTVDDFAHANHNPIAVMNGMAGTEPILIDAEVGKPLKLDASGSHDPDNGQTLHYRWFHYAEAGSAGPKASPMRIEGEDTATATVTPTAVCKEPWMALPAGMFQCMGDGTAHIILAVTDDGSPQLTSYRRVILTVHPAK